MQKRIRWCREHWLIVASCFLLAFIPLYPKLPLFDVVQTWVYIRIEDLLVAIILGIFGFSLFRSRQKPDTPLTIPIILYWITGGVATMYAIVMLRPLIPNFFPHLAVLHLIRRIEYMGLFFVGFYALWKKPKNLSAVIWTLAVTLLLIIAYGFGQKFLGWPAFLTMNEEFSKGLPLRLPPTARIPSTFAGHYDLGAYLVFIIPLFGSLAFGMKRVWQKIVMTLLAVGGLVLLLFTASRISFGVYLIAISTMLWWKHKRWFILPVIIVSFLLLNSVSTASERFYKTLRFSDVVIDLSTGQPIGTLDQLENGRAVINKKENPATENLPKGSQFLSAPLVAASLVPAKTFKTVEFYTSSPLATGAGEIATVSGSFLVQKAFVYDISITTRFQGEWPLAMEAFRRNMLFGSGYSSLSVATDGDYMRMLGETGISGTVMFLGIFLVAFVVYFRQRRALAVLEESFATGIFAGIVGLFFNAVLIDVFEASKVAFSLWLLVGAAVGVLWIRPIRLSYAHLLWQACTHKVAYVIYICVGVFFLYQKALSLYFIGDDFTWLRWAASTTMGAIPKYFTDASGFFYRPIPKLFYFLLYTVFWLKSGAYHIVAVGLFATLAILIFWLLMRLKVLPRVALLAALLFTTLAIHHENVAWVSGMSSLLSAAFLFTALIFVTYWKESKGGKRLVWWVMVLISTFLSACSYEGGLVSPVIVYLVAWAIGGAGVWRAITLLATGGAYWWLRSHAHAVPPGGDYGIRMSSLLVNVIGNSVGYLLSIVSGPRALEYMNALRASLRTHVKIVSLVGIVVVALGVWIGKSFGRYVKTDGKRTLPWLVAAGISLVPFIGLGGMAERYGLIASALFTVFIGLLMDKVFRKSGLVIRLTLLTVTALCMVWNTIELNRVLGDWVYASHVTETAVLSLKTNYFPLRDKQVFVFVNTPIRYGRAWIFPTGLDDALWHMFKFNPYPYRVYTASSVKAAFEIVSPLGVPDVLIFDKNGVLSKAHKGVQVIEVK